MDYQATIALLDDLESRGLKAWAQDGRLFVDGDATALDPALRAKLKAGRDDLLAVLAAQHPAVPVAEQDMPEDLKSFATLAQSALLPLARAHEDGARYHVPVVLDVNGTVDLDRLLQAMNILQDRHDALRQCFPAGARTPMPRPRGARIGLDVTVTMDATHPAPEAATEAALQEFVNRPFDLAKGPLWRAMAVSLANGRTVLGWVFHHLVFDGMSRDVFLTELAAIDGQLAEGMAVERRSGGWQLGDVARWERELSTGQRADQARNWWRQSFAKPWPATTVPLAPGNAPGWLRSELPFRVGEALRERARSCGLPVGAIAISAAALALRSLTLQDRILVCTPVMNRDRPEAASVIGYMSRILPLAIDISDNEPLSVVAGQISRTLLLANDFRCLPSPDLFGQPGLALCPANRFMVGWQERGETPALQGLQTRTMALARRANDFDLSIQFEADGDKITFQIDWADGVLGAGPAERLARAIAAYLSAMAGDGWFARAADVLPPAVSSEQIAAAFMRNPAVTEAFALATPHTGGFSVWLTLNEEVRATALALLGAAQSGSGMIVAPVRLVTLAALPRLYDGSVDLNTLIVTTTAEAAPDPSSLPKTQLQRDLARIWQSVLMVQRPLGIDEDFRDLGGHSLLAVRMWADVTQLVRSGIPPHLMVKARTLRQLADMIETPAPPEQDVGQTALAVDIRDGLRRYTSLWQGRRRTADSVIVGRNVDAPRIPLFWCLQNETELNQLSRYLGSDQPVYGMRSGHQIMVKSPENIRHLSTFYAEEITQLYPEGPLFLGGNCQAAVIAFEVASAARRAGREVALLILHEKMVPERYDAKLVLSFGRDSDRNPYLASDDPHADFRHYYSENFVIDLVSGKHGQFFVEPFIHDLAAMICRHRDDTPALRAHASSKHQIFAGNP